MKHETSFCFYVKHVGRFGSLWFSFSGGVKHETSFCFYVKHVGKCQIQPPYEEYEADMAGARHLPFDPTKG